MSRQIKWQRIKKNDGLCVTCGKNVNKCVTCKECSEKRRECDRKRYRLKVGIGLEEELDNRGAPRKE